MNYLAAVCVTVMKQSCHQDNVPTIITINHYCQTEETVRVLFFITRDIDQCTLKPFHQHELCCELLSALCGKLTVIPGKLILGFIDAALESFGTAECVKGCTAARMNARSMYFKQNKAVVLLAVTCFVL